MENVFVPTITANGVVITKESNQEVYDEAMRYFNANLEKAEKKSEYLNRLIDFLEEGGFKWGENLIGRADYTSDYFERKRPNIQLISGHKKSVYIVSGESVDVEFDIFPSIWGETNKNQRVCILGVDLTIDALGTYCAKPQLFGVVFREEYYRFRSNTDYTKVVSSSLTGHERGMKASTMYAKLLSKTEEVRVHIEEKNKEKSVINQIIEKYKGLYPTANVYSEDLYFRSGGRMHSRGKGVRIDFANGSYIEISVGSSGEERMFRYLDKRINTLELSDLCDHLSK